MSGVAPDLTYNIIHCVTCQVYSLTYPITSFTVSRLIYSLLIVTEYAETEYDIACLLMVFVAVSIPKLARADSSFFKASIEGTIPWDMATVVFSQVLCNALQFLAERSQSDKVSFCDTILSVVCLSGVNFSFKTTYL